MDEEEIARQLHDPSFDRRTDILEQLRAASRRNGGRLPFSNKPAIFEAVGQTLADSNWHVRNQSIQLLHELVPQFGDELDDCMRLVVSRLVGCVGDSNVSIRRAAIQTLHVYMKHTRDVSSVLQAVVAHGLENSEPRVRKEVTIALPVLCTPDFARTDFFSVTQALCKRLLDPGEQQSHALLSLEKIRGLVGEQVFNSYVHRLSPPMRRFYFKLTDHTEDENFNGHHPRMNDTSSNHYEFGVVPSHVMDKLSDQSNFRTRAQAVEELKQTIRDLQDPSALAPHVPAFIQFLTNLLDDSNFKITTVTLEILGLLVQRLGRGMEPHLQAMTAALAKRMGDNKIVVRQAIMKDVMQLMQALSPRTTLAAILDNLAHRNSRVRQETLNICIASLLTFPSYDFDLGEICQRIAHTLVDPKRQVRQASLECFANLAQTMGPGKMQPLVQAVDSVELSCEGDGVMAAVQARLARRQLPRLSVDGLVDYAILIPSSASSARGASTPQGADLDWILSASGGSGSSARSSRNEVMELESVTSSARSTPVHPDNSHGPSPRRHLSAGKSRNRLPWEEAAEQHNDNNTANPQVRKINRKSIENQPIVNSRF
ncbi:hypothetical protein CAPTEDRAFT_91714 [Capitella teleta]|uniref:TOG domain-containing protein n=1 Tax=Capitella teleta TaxID=283909 RepID=R7U327_CAPTE|nr:hypothetical protein CAPTEDRAFT_91714 [Capitella teleta]|eukprot:ELU00496.1 hypothetical protein CAPTEDRAFT_91714 [Capitella teleta]